MPLHTSTSFTKGKKLALTDIKCTDCQTGDAHNGQTQKLFQ